MRVFATVALVIMLSAQVIFLVNIVWSLRKGKKAGKNPWKANTLEWTTPSPPGHGNFEKLPEVYRGPYEYSVPGRKEDYWPQDQKNAPGHTKRAPTACSLLCSPKEQFCFRFLCSGGRPGSDMRVDGKIGCNSAPINLFRRKK